ncbi:gamma-butyrobetaine dioxygenase [Myxococcus llanfairpwllgwyngyllgogerychwyrndrobwllllantysiliogogogochensis]|uniref:Gamma-butyrobetaine dioxygenase n=1 Tax=Myxococcus llanfairpwllgwyngyllgogerychwyrndrobwllllantysiliogogogochensis TaxID=2590453 RepID=A0A540WYK8_9BACT|nr:TauD/TfdA family dioxygenase [Myxococcus llanfairpwllgwyngyllgogerychwyrndrobwllllantysiliogogogochensis]TQF14092.1 gamma-butyrobetaine dioxygenase [Myxococcus llanfairpwllgwyngyllgogerychwyrndrobwllllantysiliogogogochensis]
MPITRFAPHDDFLRVYFAGDGVPRHADFHWFWLRHNSELDRHPLTRERIVCSSELPLELRPRGVRVSADASGLDVDWGDRADGQVSRYAADWLLANAYAADRVAVPPPPSDSVLLTVEASQVREPLVPFALKRLQESGAVIVRGFEADTEALIDLFGGAGLSVIETHFGRIEDLRTDNTTNRNTDQLGYTDSAVQLHTDQPFLDRPPRYQLLHCQRPAETGGENSVVDGLAAARYLADQDAAAFELLRTVQVTFHRKQAAFERVLVSPVFDFDAPEGFRIRYSYFTLAPHRVPFARMEAWYRAYNRFATLVRDERHQFRFRLGAGDFLLYDNWRMLHARTSFTGARWVRGVYFDAR